MMQELLEEVGDTLLFSFSSCHRLGLIGVVVLPTVPLSEQISFLCSGHLLNTQGCDSL